MPDFLAGVRVIDLSQYVPGPYAALQLADMGADVVKVEPPSGDPMRRLGTVDSDGWSPFYKLVNGGKTIVRLDLKTRDGATDFERLLTVADVLVESYRPGVLERLGFGRERLQKINRGLVHCALSGWGQTGPYSLKAGHDLNYMALGGGLIASGIRDRPVIAWPPTADYASGVQAAGAICGALVRRARTGEGAYIDVSLVETVLAWQSGGLTAGRRPGIVPDRAAELLNGGAACYQIYQTRDWRFLTLGNLEDKFWANFAAAAGHPEWSERQWEAMPQDDLIAEVQAVIGTKDLSEWEAILERVDTCFHGVIEFSDVPEHPQVRARGMTHLGGGEREPMVAAAFPAWIDGVAPQPRRPATEIDSGAAMTRWAVASEPGG
jgi:alpha-methylacyl-CoA racemase